MWGTVSIDIFHFSVISNICSIEYTMNLSLQKTFDALPLPSRLTLLVQSLRKQDASVEVSASAVQQLTSCAVCRASRQWCCQVNSSSCPPSAVEEKWREKREILIAVHYHDGQFSVGEKRERSINLRWW